MLSVLPLITVSDGVVVVRGMGEGLQEVRPVSEFVANLFF